MSPVYLGGTKLNTLYVGGTKINKAYVGNTLVYSSEFIGTVTITTVIRYAGILVTDTNCVPAGAEVAMVASISGTATDATFAWSRPAGSSAPIEGLTTGTLSWTAVAGDGGTYGVTVSSSNSSDSTQSAQETINIFSYTTPGFTDADANNWIINVELRDCGALENGVRVAMNQLVVDLKSSGFYGNSDLIHPLLGARKITSLVPLKAPLGANLNTAVAYDRQLGPLLFTQGGAVLYQCPFTTSAAITSGAFGMAVYIGAWSSQTEGAFVNNMHFITDEVSVSGIGNVRVGGDFYNTVGINCPFVSLQVPSSPILAPTRYQPMFVGMQGNGSLTAWQNKLRANALTGSGSNVNLSAQGFPIADTALTVRHVDVNQPTSWMRQNYSFIIAGRGASDYSSDALRTIIQTYVTAVQAAVPG